MPGYIEVVTKENVQSWGFDDLLKKPPQIEELSQIVRNVLDHIKS